jgi:hypothetical protein
MSERLIVHADAADGDWIKGAWDIGPTNIAELREWLHGQQTTAEHFKLRIYKANVERPGFERLREL